jgi:hypothetical protein
MEPPRTVKPGSRVNAVTGTAISIICYGKGPEHRAMATTKNRTGMTIVVPGIAQHGIPFRVIQGEFRWRGSRLAASKPRRKKISRERWFGKPVVTTWLKMALTNLYAAWRWGPVLESSSVRFVPSMIQTRLVCGYINAIATKLSPDLAKPGLVTV